MKRKRKGILLTDKAVKDGVWIDNGQWEATDHSQGRAGTKPGGHKVTDEPPVFMRRDRSYTEDEARANGWIK